MSGSVRVRVICGDQRVILSVAKEWTIDILSERMRNLFRLNQAPALWLDGFRMLESERAGHVLRDEDKITAQGPDIPHAPMATLDLTTLPRAHGFPMDSDYAPSLQGSSFHVPPHRLLSRSPSSELGSSISHSNPFQIHNLGGERREMHEQAASHQERLTQENLNRKRARATAAAAEEEDEENEGTSVEQELRELRAFKRRKEEEEDEREKINKQQLKNGAGPHLSEDPLTKTPNEQDPLTKTPNKMMASGTTPGRVLHRADRRVMWDESTLHEKDRVYSDGEPMIHRESTPMIPDIEQQQQAQEEHIVSARSAAADSGISVMITDCDDTEDLECSRTSLYSERDEEEKEAIASRGGMSLKESEVEIMRGNNKESNASGSNTTMTGSNGAFLCPPSPRQALKKTKEISQGSHGSHLSPTQQSPKQQSPTLRNACAPSTQEDEKRDIMTDDDHEGQSPAGISSSSRQETASREPGSRNTVVVEPPPSTQETVAGEKHDIVSFDGLSPTSGKSKSKSNSRSSSVCVDESSVGPPLLSSPSGCAASLQVSSAPSRDLSYRERSQSWPPRDSMWKELEHITPTRPWEGEFIRYRIVEFMGSPVPVPGLSPYKVALVSRVLHEEKKKDKDGLDSSSFISPLRFVLKNRQGNYDVVEQSSLKQVHVLAQAQKQRKKKHGLGGGVTAEDGSVFVHSSCSGGGGGSATQRGAPNIPKHTQLTRRDSIDGSLMMKGHSASCTPAPARESGSPPHHHRQGGKKAHDDDDDDDGMQDDDPGVEDAASEGRLPSSTAPPAATHTHTHGNVAQSSATSSDYTTTKEKKLVVDNSGKNGNTEGTTPAHEQECGEKHGNNNDSYASTPPRGGVAPHNHHEMSSSRSPQIKSTPTPPAMTGGQQPHLAATASQTSPQDKGIKGGRWYQWIDNDESKNIKGQHQHGTAGSHEWGGGGGRAGGWGVQAPSCGEMGKMVAQWKPSGEDRMEKETWNDNNNSTLEHGGVQQEDVGSSSRRNGDNLRRHEALRKEGEEQSRVIDKEGKGNGKKNASQDKSEREKILKSPKDINASHSLKAAVPVEKEKENGGLNQRPSSSGKQQHTENVIQHPILGELEIPKHVNEETFVIKKLRRLRQAIKCQIEFYFSDENMKKDNFLREQRDAEGYVNLSLIATFNRVKALCTDQDFVRESLLESQSLEVLGDAIRRRKDSWPAAVRDWSERRREALC